MSAINFSLVENGYSPEEVDKYISMLQQEYQNAISWGEEQEKKLGEIKSEMQESGFYLTIDENNQNEIIERVFNELTATVNRVKDDAEKKSEDIVAKANEKARGITRAAMEKSIVLRTENENIMKNLKSISDMINVILNKVSQ